ncbi:hypothetical protein L228DRAFT_17820 [Xylona heveae TC161]|uniref:DUF7907 domain-containing protein n=1 Tax=Xylona heveae (strain CBS 132557 / TC161) TaxID=1328760 RepID=A0A165JX84_XYLHT|nr:hypothetical protein L228DRAFT_17820 [Xylona heveae TC161]KZF26738.1 hypothetical protein L228DRAFT_17820 [Xylona heveae TC161]
MRFSLIGASLFGLLAGLTSSAMAQFTNQSAPFYLVVISQNHTINGSALVACHEGAAIEGLCVGGSIATSSPGGIKGVSQYNFNGSSNPYIQNATLGETGLLTYVLRGGNFNESEAMGFATNPASNVALPLFYPGEDNYQLIAFDSHNRLNIQAYVDDRIVPAYSGIENKAYYRWYVCSTYYTGYNYETLAWVYGDHKPQNPTCQKVEVKRVFVN